VLVELEVKEEMNESFMGMIVRLGICRSAVVSPSFRLYHLLVTRHRKYTSNMSTIRVIRTLARQGRAFHTTVRRNDHFLNANPETLQNALSNKEKVVLVDFYADWCNPCKMLSPILEKLTSDSSIKSGTGKPLDLVTIDTDAEVSLAQQFNIRSLPTVIAFVDGEPVSQFMGAMPEQSVRNFINTL